MNEETYSINKKQFDLLKKVLINSDLIIYLDGLYLNRPSPNSSFKFTLFKEHTEEVLDRLTWFLTSEGLDDCNEPNAVGLLVEDLITIFSK